MNPALAIQPEAPDTKDARALIAELDSYLNRRYLPENRHGLPLAALRDTSVIFLVARWDGVAAGCGAVKFVPGTEAETKYAEVKRMYVAPERRGRGVAKALLAQLERLSQQKGFAALRLETGIYQPEAVRLYEGAGFSRCAAFGEYREDGISLCYEKRLPSE